VTFVLDILDIRSLQDIWSGYKSRLTSKYNAKQIKIYFIYSSSNLYQNFISSLSLICYGLRMLDDVNDIYNKRLKEIRDDYFKIGRIRCPCLNNKYVHFNQSGFRHFLRKGKTIRPLMDQLRRFALFRFATKVISSSKTKITETRYNGAIDSYKLQLEVHEGCRIKVIVIKNGGGIYQYVSVMD
jgi:hypothetical protein